jgi:NADH dehydrogenase (ubiquinone) 1 alpha subcomplex subunit 6
MAFTMRAVKVPPNSASLEEARHRVFDFFRQACRAIPSIMEIYNLDDVVTPSQLRSTIAKEIRKNQGVTNPKVPTSHPPPIDFIRLPDFVDLRLVNENSLVA